jgi:hypothetical protein
VCLRGIWKAKDKLEIHASCAENGVSGLLSGWAKDQLLPVEFYIFVPRILGLESLAECVQTRLCIPEYRSKSGERGAVKDALHNKCRVRDQNSLLCGVVMHPWWS